MILLSSQLPELVHMYRCQALTKTLGPRKEEGGLNTECLRLAFWFFFPSKAMKVECKEMLIG